MKNLREKIISMISGLEEDYEYKLDLIYKELSKVFPKLQTIYESEDFIESIVHKREHLDEKLSKQKLIRERDTSTATFYGELANFYNHHNFTPKISVETIRKNHYCNELIRHTICAITSKGDIEQVDFLNSRFIASKELLLQHPDIIVHSYKYIINFTDLIDKDIVEAASVALLEQKLKNYAFSYKELENILEDFTNSFREKTQLEAVIKSDSAAEKFKV